MLACTDWDGLADGDAVGSCAAAQAEAVTIANPAAQIRALMLFGRRLLLLLPATMAEGAMDPLAE